MVSFKLHILIVLLFSFFHPRGAAGKSGEWGLVGGSVLAAYQSSSAWRQVRLRFAGAPALRMEPAVTLKNLVTFTNNDILKSKCAVTR